LTAAPVDRSIATPADHRSWGNPVIATQAVSQIAAPTVGAVAAPVATAVAPPAVTAVATTTAAAVAFELRALGVEHFFLMTGRDNKLWIALESVGIRQVLARSEAAAVYMADAYARLRGRPTFVYGAYGPGAANVAGSLAEPFWSGSPVVALTSAMRRADRFRKEYQELDQPALFASVTKWGVEASVPTHVPKLVREAARHALSGPPGPVYLGIPSDLFEAEIPDYREPAALDQPVELPLARPAPTDADADAVVRALMSAQRPIILAGNGIHQSGAHEALRKVAERLGIPVVTSSAGKGSISETHALALGSVGRYSRNYANAAMRDADVILAIGTQLGGLVTDSYRLISSGAQLIHVNVDPEVIGLNFPTQLGLVADARTFLEAVLDASDRLEAHRSVASSAHVENLARERAAWRERRAGLAAHDGSDGRPMRPEAVMAVVEAQMASDAVLVADTGYAAAWAGALAEVRVAGRQFLRADGSLGWAFPASLGAQLAAPDRQVICITGDGGFGYHIGEIETALRLQLPVVVIVLNNDFYDVDYGQVARAFGAQGFRVTTAAEFSQALAIGLERRGPTVIDAIIDREAIAPVTRYDRVRIREL
jgi:acetolactate synthase-1/2/3 large subunit